jgi:hypothetical protein
MRAKRPYNPDYYRVAFTKAKRRLRELIKELGGECAKCHARQNLHVDHMDGRSWEPREVSYHCRVLRYWREYRVGVRLRALCNRCNGWATGNRRGQ